MSGVTAHIGNEEINLVLARSVTSYFDTLQQALTPEQWAHVCPLWPTSLCGDRL